MSQTQQSAQRWVESSDGWLKTSQLTMHYLDWGGEGPYVVALHGLASSAHWYDLVLPRLTDQFHCIALDQRAHGQTDQPDTGYDWHTLATDVAEAMDALGIERASVLGHSWGASVAAGFAVHYPERVEKVALIDGGFFRPRGEMTWEQFKQRLSPRDIYGPKERYLGSLRQQLADCWSEQLEHMLMSMVRIDPDGTVWERLEPHNHEQVLWAMWTEPSHMHYPHIKAPTLLVPAGPRSDANPEFTQRKREGVQIAMENLPNARVRWVPETIHDIGFHKPDELAQVLREFLAE